MKPSDYIRRGWCQGQGSKGDERCLVQAIVEAYPDEPERRFAIYDKFNFSKCDLAVCGSINWNDDPNRTQQEVIDALVAIGE